MAKLLVKLGGYFAVSGDFLTSYHTKLMDIQTKESIPYLNVSVFLYCFLLEPFEDFSILSHSTSSLISLNQNQLQSYLS